MKERIGELVEGLPAVFMRLMAGGTAADASAGACYLAKQKRSG